MLSALRIDPADRRVAIVLVTSALALTINNFAADDPAWLVTSLDTIGFDGWSSRLARSVSTGTQARRNDLVFWAAVQIFSYVVPAAVVIRFVLRERLRDHGVRIRGTLAFAVPYAIFFAAALPAIVFASTTDEFQTRYPFLRVEPGEPLGALFVWWTMYALQFCALEFFFRGFMMHGLHPRFGNAAVFVMAVPYNMLHYGKPILEALAAIVGAVVLGLFAIRSRTIWWGALLHIAVALTMDTLSLWQQELF
jgi:uncharacterized protein